MPSNLLETHNMTRSNLALAMNKLNLLSSVFFAACLLGSTAAAQGQQPDVEDNTLFWHTKLDDAKAEARETGKPLFLEFRCAP